MASPLEGVHTAVEAVVKEVTFLIEVVAGLLLVAAVIQGLWLLARAVGTGHLDEEIRRIRLRFGRGVVLALEFLVAADVLSTIIAPTIERVALVGAIVVLRTVLAVAVEWELRQVEKEGQRATGVNG